MDIMRLCGIAWRVLDVQNGKALTETAKRKY